MKKRIKIILLLILILTISVICKNSKSYAADTTVPITLDDSFENDNNNDEINMPLRGGYRLEYSVIKMDKHITGHYYMEKAMISSF